MTGARGRLADNIDLSDMCDLYDEDYEEIVATWDKGSLVMGRYLLQEKIGSGGMGEVWRATDQVVEQDVAIKFLVGVVDRDARRRFASEVRAMARLDHPHIVAVLDQGVHDNAPLFVMSRLAGLPLGRWVRLANWERVALVFDQVLDALAYAHARGIIHRDLKPSNILITGPPEHPHAVVLDFGIAIDPWADGLVTGEIVGSPGYMAPEQRRGETWRARESTDLFACGILLYEALCGKPPFGKAIRNDDFASSSFLFPRARFPLEPRTGFEPLAEALEPLLQRLLSIRVAERPLLAADVREELARQVEVIRRGQQGSDVLAPWDDEEEPEGDQTELLSPWHPVYLAPRSLTTRPPPGAYGLYGLRASPVLGRDEELDVLWRAARRAFASGSPRVVCLEGISGIGKSHLASHLCERANEQGLARFVEVVYLPKAPATSGLVAALEQLMRVRQAVGLESARQRLEAWLHDEDAESDALVDSLLGLLRPVGPGNIGPALKSTLFLSVVRAMCRHRAVVVLIKDAQHCQDGSATYLLDELLQQDAMPVLALATVRVDEQDPSFTAEYPALLEHPRVERIQLGPLPEGAVRSLIRSSLALEPQLEDLLVERSEGLPLLATQMLDELFRGGALEIGPEGGRLKPNRELAALPSGMRSLWADRIERVRATDDDGTYWVDALQGLALARVALTRPVLEAAAAASGEDLDDAVAAWEKEGLLIQDPDESVRFCHSGFAREVADGVAPEAAVRWNVIWAAALARLEVYSRGRYGLERGLHLLDAGESEEALSALLAGAEHAYDWGDTHRMREAASRAQDLANDIGDRVRLAWSLRWQGAAELAAGRLDQAERLLEGARRLFELERVLVGLGAALESMAWASIYRASYESAVELATQGAEAFRRAQDEPGLANALGTLGLALVRLHRYAEARTVLAEAEDVARQSDDGQALAGALRGQAACARYEGDLDGAERAYTAALELASRHWQGVVPMLHDGLGLVALSRGDLATARDRISRALEQALMEGQRRLQVVFYADLAAVALLSNDPATAASCLDHVEQGLDRLDQIDEHAQVSLELALTEDTARQNPELVRRAAALAAKMWERLDRQDETDRVMDRLDLLTYELTVRDDLS